MIAVLVVAFLASLFGAGFVFAKRESAAAVLEQILDELWDDDEVMA